VGSFAVSDVRYLFDFAVYLLVAMVTSTLAARLRDQVEAAREREKRTAALYSLSNRVAAETDMEHVLQRVVEAVTHSISADVAILMPGPADALLEVVAGSGNRGLPWGKRSGP